MVDSPTSQNPSFKDRRDRLAGLFADASATSILVLRVRILRLNFDAGDQSFNMSSVTCMDHEGQSLGLGGRVL